MFGMYQLDNLVDMISSFDFITNHSPSEPIVILLLSRLQKGLIDRETLYFQSVKSGVPMIKVGMQK